MLPKYTSNKGLVCAWEESPCEKGAAKRGYCNAHYMKHYGAVRLNNKPCTVEGCLRPHRARGFCANHYDQMYQKNREAVVDEDSHQTKEYYDGLWEFVKKELRLA
jgi:hypothetical protein